MPPAKIEPPRVVPTLQKA